MNLPDLWLEDEEADAFEYLELLQEAREEVSNRYGRRGIENVMGGAIVHEREDGSICVNLTLMRAWVGHHDIMYRLQCDLSLPEGGQP